MLGTDRLLVIGIAEVRDRDLVPGRDRRQLGNRRVKPSHRFRLVRFRNGWQQQRLKFRGAGGDGRRHLESLDGGGRKIEPGDVGRRADQPAIDRGQEPGRGQRRDELSARSSRVAGGSAVRDGRQASRPRRRRRGRYTRSSGRAIRLMPAPVPNGRCFGTEHGQRVGDPDDATAEQETQGKSLSRPTGSLGANHQGTLKRQRGDTSDSRCPGRGQCLFSDWSPDNAQQSQPDPRLFTSPGWDSRHNRPESFAWHNRDPDASSRDPTSRKSRSRHGGESFSGRPSEGPAREPPAGPASTRPRRPPVA